MEILLFLKYFWKSDQLAWVPKLPSEKWKVDSFYLASLTLQYPQDELIVDISYHCIVSFGNSTSFYFLPEKELPQREENTV